MNKYEIIQKIETFAPPNKAEEWDCVGFMVETQKVEISKIMLCLTPTNEVIKQAKAQNCDMIISHHPMFFVEFNPANFKSLPDIYSAHTNLDKAQGGTTDTIISTLKLENLKQPVKHDYLRLIEFDTEISVLDFLDKLKQISGNLRYVNNKEVKTLKRVAFCAGSGAEFIKDAKNIGADALVTGDLKFHTALDSEIVLFDIGHFESEVLILPQIAKLIGSDVVEIVYANEKSPFKTI
jgi:dinuclear metal center YbgI/SA1388 family protein